MLTKDDYDRCVAALRAHPLAARGSVEEKDYVVSGAHERQYRRAHLDVPVRSAEDAAQVMAALARIAMTTGAESAALYVYRPESGAASIGVSRALDEAETAHATAAPSQQWECSAERFVVATVAPQVSVGQ